MIVIYIRYHWGLYTVQEFLQLDKIVLVSICFRMDIDLCDNLSIDKFSHLGIPTKYHNLTNIINFIARDRFFDIVIDVD